MGAKTLLTVEHLERLPETCDVSYELDQGELVEVSSARACCTISFADECSAAFWIIWTPTRTKASQSAINGSLLAKTPFVPPMLRSFQRVQPFSPALAIEIMSASHTIHNQARRIHQYLKAGTRSIWVFITAMRQIHIHSASAHPVILTAEDLLEDAALLPGFSARVEELFAV